MGDRVCSAIILVPILFGLILLPAGFAEETEPVAYINVVRGNVEVKSPTGDKSPVKPGLPLNVQDRIVTGSKGWAEIYVTDSGLVHLGPGSELLIAAVKRSEENAAVRFLQLIRGTYRAVFDRLKQPLLVGSPTAVAGIRGTRVVVNPSGISVLEGTIEASLRGKPKVKHQLYSGEAFNAGRGQVETIPFDRLGKMDSGFDMGIETNQTPYVMSHQQWAAVSARALKYVFHRSWASYTSQTYLDLLSKDQSFEIFANDYIDMQYRENAEVEQDSVGDSVITAAKGPVIVSYQVAVPVDGNYAINARSAGGSQYWTVGKLPTALSEPSFSLAPAKVGPMYIKKGIYQLVVAIPKGGKLASFNLQGPEFNGYEPDEGWQKDKVLRNKELAVFLAKLLGMSIEEAKLELSHAWIPGKLNVFKRILRDLNLFRPAFAQEQDTPLEVVRKLMADLQQKGFIFREPEEPVYGQDAALNASLLREKDEELGLSNLPQKKPESEQPPDAYRSTVSPVVPIVP